MREEEGRGLGLLSNPFTLICPFCPFLLLKDLPLPLPPSPRPGGFLRGRFTPLSLSLSFAGVSHGVLFVCGQ